jgi:hypothetical protein
MSPLRKVIVHEPQRSGARRSQLHEFTRIAEYLVFGADSGIKKFYYC